MSLIAANDTASALIMRVKRVCHICLSGKAAGIVFARRSKL